MDPEISSSEVDAALDAIIEGQEVRRGRHHLGELTERFRTRLEALGFRPTRVREVDPGGSRRVPAFLVRDEEAIFGYVFVEKFTDHRARRVFGSVERNEKGDWAVILGIASRKVIYAAPSRASSYDPENPE